MVSYGGSSGQSQSTTSPWGGQQQHLRDLYDRAQGIFNQGPYQYYGDSTVQGFDPASQEAFGAAERRSREGSSGVRAAQAENQKTSEGAYLDPSTNPWLQQTYDLAARDMGRNYYGQINQLGSRMEAAGRTGSGAHATGTQVTGENFARGLGQLGSDIYGGNYQAERDRMGQASDRAAGLADYDYRDIDAMRSVGAQREQMSQRMLDDLVARFEQGQRGGAEKLSEFAQMLGAPVMEQQATARNKSTNIGIGTCWAAAEIFGWYTEEFMKARRWLLELWKGEDADAFRDWYGEHARELATEIALDDDARARWLPFFEWAAAEGAA